MSGRKTRACVLWLLLMPMPAIADSSLLGELLSGKIITLRQSSSDKNTSESPAVLMWTDNQKTDDVAVVDASIAMVCGKSLSDLGHWRVEHGFKPSAEYHRNTSTATETNTLTAGLAYEGLLISRTPGSEPLEHQIMASIAYKDDRFVAGEGVTAHLAWSPLGGPLQIADPLRLAEGATAVPAWARSSLMYWTVTAGLQYEYGSGVAPGASGDVLRAKSAVSGLLFPLTSRRLSLGASYASWLNAERSGVFQSYDRYQDLWTASLNWNLVMAERGPGEPAPPAIAAVALGLDYNSGENPEIGKSRETYTQLALKLRL